MHPYSALPDRHFWRRFVSNTPWRSIAFHDQPKFQLSHEERIATAGSCFAQRISEHLQRVGIAPFCTETAHPLLVEYGGNTSSYLQFSARYGNIYTARQLVELYDQAFGLRAPILDFTTHEGRWYDLLRPNIQAEGFGSAQELTADRHYHLTRVRKMFEDATTFIFTLGLTEAWVNRQTGHTYPTCPGTVRGEYDPSRHAFKNFTVTEVTSDLQRLIDLLKAVNPALKLIFTVSPVPLVATNSTRNVLTASSYSKSVLRAAVGEIESANPNVDYFPSYEIINHPASFGQYLESDLREVTQRGVTHVMDCFISSYFPRPRQDQADIDSPSVCGNTSHVKALSTQSSSLAECEELFNEPHR